MRAQRLGSIKYHHPLTWFKSLAVGALHSARTGLLSSESRHVLATQIKTKGWRKINAHKTAGGYLHEKTPNSREPVREEEQEHLDRPPPAEPCRCHRYGNKGADHANRSAHCFSLLETFRDESRLAGEGDHLGEGGFFARVRSIAAHSEGGSRDGGLCATLAPRDSRVLLQLQRCVAQVRVFVMCNLCRTIIQPAAEYFNKLPASVTSEGPKGPKGQRRKLCPNGIEIEGESA